MAYEGVITDEYYCCIVDSPSGQCFDLKLPHNAIPDPEIRNLVSGVHSIFLILIVDSKNVCRCEPVQVMSLRSLFECEAV